MTETTESIQEKLQTLYTAVIELGQDVEKRLAPTPKEQFVQSLEINQTLAELDVVAEDICARARLRAEHMSLLQSAKARLEEAKAFVLLNGPIDGKNEQIRNAQLTEVLKTDLAYQNALDKVRDLEDLLASDDIELERLRAQLSALKIKARLAAATLEYLAS